MIEELLRLSECDGVLEEQGFTRRPIHWFIDLDERGNYLGLSPTIRKTVSGKLRGPQEESGKYYSRPAFFFMTLDKKNKPVSAGANRPVVELGVGSVLEVFGIRIKAAGKGERPRIDRLKKPGGGEQNEETSDGEYQKHQQFIDLHSQLAAKYANLTALAAIAGFLNNAPAFMDSTLADNELRDIAKQELSFRVSGRLVTSDAAVRKMWQAEYIAARDAVKARLPGGHSMFCPTDCRLEEEPLTPVFPHISGVPDGGGWCPLASFDKAPSQSYGLGALTVAMRLDVAERASAALNYLLRNPNTHLRLRDTVAVFWAVPADSAKKSLADIGFAAALATPDTLEVRDFLRGIWGAGIAASVSDDRFYCALLSSPQSRITVRSWHTDTLPAAQEHIRQWMEAGGVYRLAWDTAARRSTKDDFSPVSIMQLADATVRKSKETKPTKSTYTELFLSAFQGNPLSHKLFTAALQRQSVELATGCNKTITPAIFEERFRARTALIQLYFSTNKKGDSMPDNHDVEANAGYLCGRLLAILDKIHIAAHKDSGGTNSSPANRSYAAASTTPALIFPQLCSLVRVHLNKIGGGWANRLEYGNPDQGFDGLAAVCAKLRATSGNQFPRMLSLEDQGRFAIGFYYERTREWPKSKKQNGADVSASESQDAEEKEE